MGGSVSAAVVSMSMEGDAAVSSKAERVIADLSSAERAGKKAESASKAADDAAKESSKASHELVHRARHAVTELRHAVHFLEKAAKFAGVEEGSAAGIGLEALSGGAQFAKFGNALLPGGVGAALGFAGGAAFSAFSAYTQAAEEAAKKQKEEADRQAAALVEALARRREQDLEASLREQAGLRQIAAQFGGVRTGL